MTLRTPSSPGALRHASGAGDGDVLRLSPGWTRWCFWLLTAAFIAALAFCALATLHTYAAGPAVVWVAPRAQVASPVAGTVMSVEVRPGQRVEPGRLLVRLSSSSSRLADARLTFSFLERLMALPYSFFQRRSAGDILMRWNSNAHIRETLGSGMLSGMLDGLLMLGYFALLFALSITTGLLVCSLCVVQIGVFLVTSRERRERNAMLIARQARCQSRQVEMVTGIETLKVMGVETRAQEEWSNLFVDVLNASLEQGSLAVRWTRSA